MVLILIPIFTTPFNALQCLIWFKNELESSLEIPKGSDPHSYSHHSLKCPSMPHMVQNELESSLEIPKGSDPHPYSHHSLKCPSMPHMVQNELELIAYFSCPTPD